jgi:hypothetical protein
VKSCSDKRHKYLYIIFFIVKHRESKCQGLLCVRRLIRHHAGDAVQQLHVLILAVVAEVITAFFLKIYTVPIDYDSVEHYNDYMIHVVINTQE